MKANKSLAVLVLTITLFSKLFSQQTFFTILNGGLAMPNCVHETTDGHYFCTCHGTEYFLLDSAGALNWSKNLTDPNLQFDGQYSVPTYDHGFIASGPVNNFWTGDSYGYIAKMDSSGHIQWMSKTPTTNDFLGYSFSGIEQTADSGYILAGGHSQILPSPTRRGALIMKIDASGNTTWSKVIVPDTNVFYQSQSISVKITPNGDYILAGITDYSLMLSRLTPNGNLLWTKTYLPDSISGLTVYVDVANDGGFIICSNMDPTANNQERVCLLKTDSAGNPQWCKVYGNPGQMGVKCVRATDDGGYAFIGMQNSLPYMGGAIGKTDSSGNLQWVSMFDSIFVWQTTKWSKHEFEQTSDHGYIFGGTVYNPAFSQTFPCIIKTDPNGIAGCKGHPITMNMGNLSTSVNSIAYSFAGETLALYNYTEQPGIINDSLVCAGNFSENPKGIAENPAAGHFLFYPDPAKDFLHIDTDFNGTLEIYNVSGELIKKEMVHAGSQELDIRMYPAGLYFAVINNGTTYHAQKFVHE